MDDNKNLFLAIALSLAVLLGWNAFFAPPVPSPAQKAAEAAGSQTPGSVPDKGPITTIASREEMLVKSPRVSIETPRLIGSLPLTGGEIDDLALKEFHETVDPNSPIIKVLEPHGSHNAYYADFGWAASADQQITLPNAKTVWTASHTKLTPQQPVTLSWDNGAGLVFKRHLSVDQGYALTITDSVDNNGDKPVTLNPFSLIRRYGNPATAGYYILHEGLVGVVGEQGLQEEKYANIDKENPLAGGKGRGKTYKEAVGGFAGITDKYWAAVLAPDQTAPYTLTYSGSLASSPTEKNYQVDLLMQGRVVPVKGSVQSTTTLFVGAKEVKTIAAYSEKLNIKNFDLLIDWGWFYFITKPMFMLIDLFYHLVGNFGLSILIVTVIVKAIFYPLASKSYVSMAKMKALQPQITDLRERFKDDKIKQQQEMMELYKREQINPLAGCLPILIQIPVFFSLYKVLFVTLEMRHAPFYGWIQDLSAPDPTTLFNLFGLIPWTPPHFLMLGIWPIIMGITMFIQMKMNPEPPDPVQKAMFAWMPLIFTFMLASFPAGLVIYWSWNNTLSVLQQYTILKRQGVKVELWDNLRKMTGKNPA